MSEEDFLNKKYGKEYKAHLLEQYKIITGSADRVTDKRQNTNKYYLAINSFLFTAATFLASRDFTYFTLVVSFVGVMISILWYQNIDSFRTLNSAKFKVIHDMEKELPARVYWQENQYLSNRYYKLTAIERKIPYVFLFMYGLIVVYIISTYF